ncbi:MAG: hypothetical protein AAGI51_11085 [Pseudomonadota bacterium]
MFDTTTFLSVWYWALLAVFWATATHFTHGVPFDVMRRAQRFGGEDLELFDRLARRLLDRIEEGVRRAAAWGIAGGAFVLAGLATAAVIGWAEWAQGLLAIAGPAAWMIFMSIREALSLREDLIAAASAPEGPPSSERLLQVYFRRRWANQFIGTVSLALAASAMMTLHRDHFVFWTF